MNDSLPVGYTTGYLPPGYVYAPVGNREYIMANVNIRNGYTRVELSAEDTYAWAKRPGDQRPCSVLAGYDVWAEFEPNGDLVNYGVGNAITDEWMDPHEVEVSSAEFDAIMADHLPISHPARR